MNNRSPGGAQDRSCRRREAGWPPAKRIFFGLRTHWNSIEHIFGLLVPTETMGTEHMNPATCYLSQQ
jgi:hypothetical protein